MRIAQIRPQFVEFVPDLLEGGILYISVPFRTASHLCACGCLQKVVTPIGPTEWALTWDGDVVSLHPSIGNWSFPCRSHYWILENRIVWAPRWSARRIRAGRKKDAKERSAYFEKAHADTSSAHNSMSPVD